MKETLKRELNKTYLILSSEESLYEESYEVEMILKNNPPGILPMHALRVDGEIKLFYDVSAKQHLKDYAERNKLSAETIRTLFEAIVMLIKEVKNYLLDMECIVLDLEHIYTMDGKFYFCYCPWEQKEVVPAFREMLEEILGCLDYRDTQGVELAYHFYQSACKGDFCIAEILEEHCQKEEKAEEEFAQYFLEQKEKQEVLKEELKEPDDMKRKGLLGNFLKFFLKKEKAKEPLTGENFYVPHLEPEIQECKLAEESNYAKKSDCFEGNTVFLSHIPGGIWRIRPRQPGFDEFSVTGDSFLIGKRKSCVDGYIDKDTISRIHSRMFVKNGSLYIADANSTNGTFVNGESIPPGKEVEIFPGDRILFADVEYECYNSL